MKQESIEQAAKLLNEGGETIWYSRVDYILKNIKEGEKLINEVFNDLVGSGQPSDLPKNVRILSVKTTRFKLKEGDSGAPVLLGQAVCEAAKNYGGGTERKVQVSVFVEIDLDVGSIIDTYAGPAY